MRVFSTLPPHRFSPRASSLIAALLLAFAAASEGYAQTTAPISSQSWNYKIYSSTTGLMRLGWITVETKDGGFSFRKLGSNLFACDTPTLKTTVEKMR